MRKLVKSIIVCMFAVTLVGTMMPNTFVATAHAAAGAQDGQIEYIGGTKSTAEGDTYDIAVSKTIEPVAGKENYFDITLKTTSHKHEVDMSTDVIIVMDISNTMNNTIGESKVIKLDQAKAATKQFVEQYCTEDDLALDRRLGIVTFNTNAQIAVDLKEANSLDVYEADFENQINNITAPKDPSVKYTNIEGGLQLAYNILEESTAKNKFVILLTDGFPTTYIESDGTSKTKINGYSTYTQENGENFSTFNEDLLGKDNNGILKNLGYMVNAEVQKVCNSGVDYSDYGAQRAQAVAKAMTEDEDDNYNIFSVGIGIGGMTINYYLELFKDADFSTIDTNAREGSGDTYTIGDATETDSYKNWLGRTIAGGKLLSQGNSVRYSDGDSEEELQAAYAGILNTIKVAPNSVMNEFYTIDPMSGVADFVGFYNKSGALADNPNALIGESKLNAENSAVYGETGNKGKIHWDMSNSGFTKNGEEFVYELKYRVRLTNEADGFNWNTEYEMNDTTTFYYSQKYTATGEKVPGSDGSLNYPIPKTEGYKGILKLKKTDGDTNEALANVEFTLKHLGEKCPVCNGDADISDMTEKSDENGCLEFDNIPSGHKYTLVENEPNGYAPVDGFDVEVAYGETLINDMLVTADENGYFGIVNRELAMNGIKTLNGKPAAENAFEFAIQQISDEGKAVGNEIVVKNGKDGEIEFTGILKNIVDDITSEVSDSEDPTSELVRTYKIYEKAGENAGITYDDTYYLLKVGAKEQEGTAYYKFSARLQKIDGENTTTLFDSDSTKITPELKFENTYEADPIAISPVVSKTLTGREWNNNDEFTFKITPDESTNRAIAEKNVVISKDTVVINKENKDQEMAFEDIIFNAPGIYKFVISEKKGDIVGVKYDEHEVNVTVEVTDSGVGNLIAAATYEGSTKFVNEYTPEPIGVALEGQKNLSGRELKEDEFKFTIDAVTEDAPLPANTKASNDSDGKISFGTMMYDQAGTYKYLITEVNNELPAVGYDENAVSATVTVEYDPATGKYSASVAYDKAGENEFVFNNTYSPAPITISFGGTKTVVPSEGNSYELAAETFSFKLIASDDNPSTDPLSGQQIFTHDKNGKINIDAKYTEAGIYKYTLSELSQSIMPMSDMPEKNDGIVYDTTVHNIVVNVTDDGRGNLSAVVETPNTRSADSGISFNNGYDPTETSTTIYGIKTINSGTKEPAAGDFKFTIRAKTEGAPLPDATTVSNESSGLFQFGAITYSSTGTYEYEIAEVEGNKKGYTYDDSTRTVTVTVEDIGGALSAKVDGVQDSDGKALINFDNSYVPLSGNATFGGKKVLEGRPLVDGEFEFVLLKGEEVIDTVSCDAEGDFEFTVPFEETGKYSYTVVEKDTEVAGITYDLSTVYGVEFEVIDNEGQLEISEDGIKMYKAGEAAEGMVFNNIYTPAPTAVQFTALKALEGKVLNDGEFTFVIEDEDGNVIQSVKNAADGKITFEEIKYDAAGTYKYRIYEKNDGAKGITYDDTVYEITVEVTDDLNGNLNAEVLSEDVVPTFINTWDPAEDGGVDTGDIFNMMPYIMLMQLALAGALAVLLKRKRA